jgi:GT2 family glycosyltransferase
MTAAALDAAVETAIVIPARNEEDRIGDCLAALAPQLGPGARVVVVANNCTDRTVARARAALPPDLLAVCDIRLPAGQGVGRARRIGAARALALWPGLRALLTSDADCRVAPDWIAASLAHLAEVDAVCGLVEPIPSETAILRHMPAREGQDEAAYRALVQRFYALVHPEPHNPLPHHGEAPGASLGLRAEGYLRVGGFANLRTGEDRHLIRRMRAAGLLVRHAGDVRVFASCRLEGRAPGGMAQALRDRLAGTDYRVDDALPPVAWLLSRARRGRLPPWPPRIPARACLRPADLPAQIARLTAVLRGMEGAHPAAPVPVPPAAGLPPPAGAAPELPA